MRHANFIDDELHMPMHMASAGDHAFPIAGLAPARVHWRDEAEDADALIAARQSQPCILQPWRRPPYSGGI